MIRAAVWAVILLAYWVAIFIGCILLVAAFIRVLVEVVT